MNKGTLQGFGAKVDRIRPLRTTWYFAGSGKHRWHPDAKRYTAELQAPGGGGSGTYTSGPTYPGHGGGAGGRTRAGMIPLGPVDWQIGSPGLGGLANSILGGTDGGDVVFGVLAAEGGKGAKLGLPGDGGKGVGRDGVDGGRGGSPSQDALAAAGVGGKRPGGAGTEANGGLPSGGNKSGGGGGGSSPYGRGGKGADAGVPNQRGGTGDGFGGGGGGGANNGDGRGGDARPGFICIKEYAE